MKVIDKKEKVIEDFTNALIDILNKELQNGSKARLLKAMRSQKQNKSSKIA